jgi:hypothetical protein
MQNISLFENQKVGTPEKLMFNKQRMGMNDDANTF